MTAVTPPPTPLQPRDFASDQEVRWCPGCGDYAILKAVHKTLADLGAIREKTVVVSGIGCSSRFPYYVNTYGFHSIHGRAPAIASGIKLANPELDVWIVTGDGDGLSIGGNHMLHLLRRNLNLQVILFNNEIYGLTKGQYSPTSRKGTKSPSTPQGSLDTPVLAGQFALGAGAHFVARAVDTAMAQMVQVLKRAHAHHGTSFVEVFQNCVVFNDGVFDGFTAKDTAVEGQLHCEHGLPLLFGKDRQKGIRLVPGKLELEVVTLGENGVILDDVLVHDEKNRLMAMMLTGLQPPFPVAVGVLYCNPAATSYEDDVYAQIGQAGPAQHDINALLRQGQQTWTVDG